MLRTLFGLRPVRRIATICAAAALGLLSQQVPTVAQDVPATIPVTLQNLALDGQFTNGGQATASALISSGRRFGAWTVELGNVGLHVNEFSTPGGFGNVVDLNGTRSGSISQTIDTIGGAPYTVSFLMSGNWTTNPARSRGVTVRLGLQRMSFTRTRPVGWSKANPQWQLFTAQFTGAGGRTALRFGSDNTGIPDGAIITAIEVRGPIAVPGPLNSVPVPTPPNLADFVQDHAKAVALGKALYWDMQVGGDGRTACATCHWHAGADVRTANMFNPGAPGSAFGPQRPDSTALKAAAAGRFRGAAKGMAAADFPFHKVANRLLPKDPVTNPVLADSMEVVGSEGVVSQNFLGIVEGSEVDRGEKRSNPLFESGAVSLRQTTARNSPSVINAVFHDRTFWDGRANRFFNGVNEFGDLDPNARVLRAAADGSLTPVRVLLDNATLASQAVGPVGSPVEMSWLGRSFPDVGRKLFSLRPLALQRVAADDSVLGVYRDASGKGLNPVAAGYASLIRSAFRPEWWSGTQITADGYTQMEANFSLFWGLSIMLYEATLVSDQTPFDRFAQGEQTALSEKARVGLSIFMNEGRCIDCHTGPEFAGATVNGLRPINGQQALIETMAMVRGTAFYDTGFYNIGVRPTAEDLGIGASHPVFGPLSYVRQEQAGRDRDGGLNISPRARVTADGAFKSPTLRNVELTGPYMHNGSMKSLTEVMEFYTRGADFFHENANDLAPGMQGIPALQNNPESVAAVVEFMLHLTDERVRIQAAPFDHPELLLPNGPAAITEFAALDNFVRLPETGRAGGAPFGDFETILVAGLGLPAPLVDTAGAAAPLAAETLGALAEPEVAAFSAAAADAIPADAATAAAAADPAVEAVLPPETLGADPTAEAGATDADLAVAEDATGATVVEEPMVEEPTAAEAVEVLPPVAEETGGVDPVPVDAATEAEITQRTGAEEALKTVTHAEETAEQVGETTNRESISLTTPEGDDVPASKKHLTNRKVKSPRETTPEEGSGEEAPPEGSAVGEEVTEEPGDAEVADEEAVAEEPAVDEEMADEPADEEGADEEAAVEEPAVDEEAAEEHGDEEAADEESVVEGPAVDEEMADEPADDEGADEEAAVEEPAVDEEAAEEHGDAEVADEEAVAEEPAIGEEMADELADEEGGDEEAAPEEPAVDEETAVEPGVDEDAAEEVTDIPSSEPISLPTPDAEDVPESK
ncbi:MAG: hypothetical protein RLZZ436_3214, partial [Planctomycetota bacterium]